MKNAQSSESLARCVLRAELDQANTFSFCRGYRGAPQELIIHFERERMAAFRLLQVKGHIACSEPFVKLCFHARKVLREARDAFK